ncbi:MAG: TIGR03016 family PEP-CTERM system-associated outer membrane protein [Nitrospiraceae bacterium]|nr:TIGR03016 family PEP-CTERM system-associated outer membrane protein [Nitrospiraceae bacterium]
MGKYRAGFLKIWGAALFLLLIFHVRGASGAQFSAKSSLSVDEEYNDNVYLTEKDRTTDYITRVLPSLSFGYKAPLWNWDLAYTMDYRHYLNGSVGDNFANDLSVTNSTQLIKKFFYLDAKELYTRSSLSLTRNYTQESLFVNQTDRNEFDLTPHFTLRPGSGTKVDVGYTYQNIWYKSSLAVSKQDNGVYAEAKKAVSPNLEINAGALYHVDNNDIEDYNKTYAHAGSKYTYAPGCYLFFDVGDNILDFKQSGTSNQLSWDAGVNHQIAAFAVKIESSSQIVENPTNIADKVDTYSISLASDSARTPFTLNLFLGEYRDVRTETLRTRSYGVTATVSHNFTPHTAVTASATAERLDDELFDTYTNLVLSGLGFNYQIARRVALTFNYQFVYSHSPVVMGDRYLNNQLTAGTTVTF